MNRKIDTNNKIKKAIDTHEILEIKYHGGTNPGTNRYIIPVGIIDDKIRARCFNSKKTKLFFIHKIEIIDKVTANEKNKKI